MGAPRHKFRGAQMEQVRLIWLEKYSKWSWADIYAGFWTFGSKLWGIGFAMGVSFFLQVYAF